MIRSSDIETATAENFEEIKFEEKFLILAKKYGLAGKELHTGRRLDKRREFGYPNGDAMVEDIRGDEEQRIRQKAHDEVFTDNYKKYLVLQQDYEEKMTEAKKPDYTGDVGKIIRPTEPLRFIVPEPARKAQAKYRVVHATEYNIQYQQAEKAYKDYLEKKQQLCAELLSKIDDVLRTVVQQHAEYDNAVQDDDIITLFSIVKDSATGKGAHSTYVLFARLFRLKQKDDSAEALAQYNNDYARTINDLERLGNADDLWEALRNAKYVEGLKKDGIFAEKITTVMGATVWPSYKDFGNELMRIARTTKGIQMINRGGEDGLITADIAKFKRKGLTCFNCGREGHRVKQCKAELHQCVKCKRFGHKEIYCETVSKLGDEVRPDQRGSTMPHGRGNQKAGAKAGTKRFKKVWVKKDEIGKGKVKAKAAEIDDDEIDDQDVTGNDEYVAMYVEDDLIDDDYEELDGKTVKIELEDDAERLFSNAMKIESDNEIHCHASRVRDEIIVVDTGCVGNGHVVKNRDLIDEEETMKFRVTGFDGNSKTSNVAGNVPGLGRSVYVENAPNNLLNLLKLCEDIGGQYTGNSREMIIYDREGHVFGHARVDKEGFLSFQYGDIYPQGSVKANSASNESGEYFTREERDRAKLAFKLCKQMAHPGDKNLMASLDNNHYAECHLTGKDLKNARKLFGPCTECLLSKMRGHTSKSSNTPPAEEIGQKLFMDLIFYGHATIGSIIGSVFAVDEKTGYCYVSGFTNKETKTINEAIKSIVHHFNSHRHDVKHIVFDDENVFRAQRSLLNSMGIKTSHTPAGLHNKRAERYIQTFKQRFEATKLTCEYVLPDKLDHVLAQHVIERMNSNANSVSGNSNPYQLVTDSKAFIPKWSFGQPGIFQSPKENAKQKGEWGFYIGTDFETPNHLLAWFPHKDGKYSRRKFVPNDNIPAGWKLTPRYLPVIPSDEEAGKRSSTQNVVKHNPRFDPTLLSRPIPDASSTHRKGDNEGSKASDVIADDNPHIIPVGPSKEDEKQVNSDASASNDDISAMVPSPTAQPIIEKELAAVEQIATESIPFSTPTKASAQSEAREKTPEPGKTPIKETKVVINPQPTRERIPRKAKELNYTHGPAKMRNKDAEEREKLVNAKRMSITQALKDKGHLALTRDAINSELRSLVETNAIQPVYYHDVDGDVIGCHLFLVDKFDSTGAFTRRKARAASRGDEEDEANILRTDSPTVIPGSVNVLLTLAAENPNSFIEAYDVVTAYLGTPMRVGKRLFMRFNSQVTQFLTALYPDYAKFVDQKGELYCLLLKYIYGLSEASREFHLRLDKILKVIGFNATEADPCVYQKKTPWGVHRICTHVDDILSNAPTMEARKDFERDISKHLEIKSNYDKLSYLGMTIHKTDKGISVSQEGYLEKLLKKYKVDDSGKAINAPCLLTLINEKEEKTYLPNARPYIGLVMSLMYLARFSRPDILFAVTYLATKCQRPTEDDYKHGIRVLRYLAQHKDARLLYKPNGLKIEVYCDASHLLHADGKGHSGAVVLLGGNHIYSFSGKQKLQARSSTEAELIALDEIATYVVWLRYLLEELGIKSNTPSTIYQDNLSGIDIVQKGGNFKRTKHMVGKFGYIKEQVNNKAIQLIYKPTKLMWANWHTKPVGMEEIQQSIKAINLFY